MDKVELSYSRCSDPELMHMIRKGQGSAEKGKDLSFAEQFYALAT